MYVCTLRCNGAVLKWPQHCRDSINLAGALLPCIVESKMSYGLCLLLIQQEFMSAGDQVLEYNGIVLTGKTFEEVQRITSQPNGEIELVIKA